MNTKHLPENIVDDRGTLACCDAGLPAARRQLAHVEPEHLRALDRISIEGLEVFANHGVFPEENTLGQKFVVSVTFYTDTRRAGETDDLSASIHYGEAAHAIDEFMRAHTFKLIEAAAE
ncbi:MAG: dihydroneopterin aldolase, partial [Collinsella intestinalis]|nr:dihydroneopterin aldolase [Collinsella intestinalis]